MTTDVPGNTTPAEAIEAFIVACAKASGDFILPGGRVGSGTQIAVWVNPGRAVTR